MPDDEEQLAEHFDDETELLQESLRSWLSSASEAVNTFTENGKKSLDAAILAVGVLQHILGELEE